MGRLVDRGLLRPMGDKGLQATWLGPVRSMVSIGDDERMKRKRGLSPPPVTLSHGNSHGQDDGSVALISLCP